MTTETPAPPSREPLTVWLVTEERDNPFMTLNIFGVFSSQGKADAYAATLTPQEIYPGQFSEIWVEAMAVDAYAALLAAGDAGEEKG